MNTLYLRIKELADERGESLAQLERNLKFSNGIISTWKKGKASSDKIEKVADYFNVTTDYLLGRASDPNPANNDMTKNQKLIAHSIDPDVTDEEREIIIGMVKEAMKFRRRLQDVILLTDLEKIEDMYPELSFWGIEVNHPAYHGSIFGKEVYINTLQDSLDWLVTALHEISHYENDYGNFNNLRLRGTLEAEGWAVRESKVRMKAILSKKYDFYKVN